MALGKPSISTPNALDLRALQTAISNTRQRIEALEALITTLGTSSATSPAVLSSTVLATLRAQIAALTTRVTALEAMLPSSAGMVAWNGSIFIGRTLQGSGGIVITNPTGVSGDPVISGAGSDELALDDTGRVGLTTEGTAVFMS